MKRLIPLLLIAGLGFAAGTFLMGSRHAARHARELEAQRAAWEAEKAGLEAALAQANDRANQRRVPVASVIANPAPKVTARKLTAQELIEKLKAVRIAPGPAQSAAAREAIVLFNELEQLGPDALPAIRQFLALNQDVDYDANLAGKGLRDIKSLTDAVLPVSLRFGLFGVVRQIGGEAAEKLFAELIASTGRGVEVAYLARVLEEMAPGKYTETTLSSARELLGRGAPVSNSALDRFHRDYLYDVLKLHRDTSYVSTAQSQLIQSDGKVDRSALRYLQQTLGSQSIAIASQAYQDPRVKEPDRESLARVGLAYVGVDPQAAEMFHTTIFDPALTPDHRRELVHDLDQDGLSNDKNPTPADLQIIANRYILTQVEDSARLRQTVSTWLRRNGFAVDTSADGEDAIFQAETKDYDVILLDIMLPKLDHSLAHAGARRIEWIAGSKPARHSCPAHRRSVPEVSRKSRRSSAFFPVACSGRRCD